MTSQQQLVLGAGVVLLFVLWPKRARAGVTTDVSFGLDDSPIGRMAQAIAVAEGFYDGDTAPRRANNPGSLKVGAPYEPTAGGQGITKFPTAAAGWSALRAQLQRIVDGRSAYYTLSSTVSQMGLTWSGGDPNWAVNVAGALNIAPSTQLAEVLT